MGTRCANHVTPLYPQKLALTSPTCGGRSVGMVRSRTKATEFSLVFRKVLVEIQVDLQGAGVSYRETIHFVNSKNYQEKISRILAPA